MDKRAKKMGIGVIVRDSQSEVLPTLSSPKAFITNPTIAEATATLRAVSFVQELGFFSMILEGDAFQIVQALKKDGVNRSKFNHLTEKDRDLLQSLHSWRILHVHRYLNEATYCLTKDALRLREDLALIEEFPSCIFDIVSLECCI